jgi:hypothetical protein
MVWGPNFHVVNVEKNLKSRKNIKYILFMAGTTKNEPKMQENPRSRDLKLGFHCMWLWWL